MDEKLTIGEWLDTGIRNNFCTQIACQTHDGVGYTTEEEAEFEDGGDPCVFIVRINTEMSSEYPFANKEGIYTQTLDNPSTRRDNTIMEIKQWHVNVFRLTMIAAYLVLLNFALAGLLKDVPGDKHVDKIFFAGVVYYAVQEAWDYLKKFFNGIKPTDWDKDPYQ